MMEDKTQIMLCYLRGPVSQILCGLAQAVSHRRLVIIVVDHATPRALG